MEPAGDRLSGSNESESHRPDFRQWGIQRPDNTFGMEDDLTPGSEEFDDLAKIGLALHERRRP
jgi:hypothetical protein